MCPYDLGNIIWLLEAFIYFSIKCSLCNTYLFDTFYVKLVTIQATPPLPKKNNQTSVSLTVFYDD